MRNKERAQNKDKKVKGNAEFEVITKAVAPGPVDQEIGLIADGRGKTGAGPKTYGDDKRFRINA